jgi:hypothetical protein
VRERGKTQGRSDTGLGLAAFLFEVSFFFFFFGVSFLESSFLAAAALLGEVRAGVTPFLGVSCLALFLGVSCFRAFFLGGLPGFFAGEPAAISNNL